MHNRSGRSIIPITVADFPSTKYDDADLQFLEPRNRLEDNRRRTNPDAPADEPAARPPRRFQALPPEEIARRLIIAIQMLPDYSGLSTKQNAETPPAEQRRETDVELLVRLGQAEESMGKLHAARTLYTCATVNTSQEFGAWTALGNLNLRLGELFPEIRSQYYAEAMNAFERAFALAGNSRLQRVQAYISKGQANIALLQLTAAVKDLSEAIRIGNEAREEDIREAIGLAYYHRGCTYLTLRRVDVRNIERAIQDFEWSVRFLPHNNNPLKKQATAFLINKQKQEAIAALTRALLVFPNDFEVLFERAEIRTDLGLYDLALRDYELIRELIENREEGDLVADDLGTSLLVRMHLGKAAVYLKKQEYDLAITELGAARTLQPKHAAVWNALGMAYAGSAAAKDRENPHAGEADYRSAIDAWLNALQFEADLSLYQLLGDACTALNQPKEAKRYYRLAMPASTQQIEGSDPENRPSNSSDQSEANLEAYEQILRTNPTEDAWLRKAGILYHRGNLTEALGAYEQALLDFPQSVTLLFNKSVMLWGLKRYPEALAICDAIIQTHFDHADAYNGKGLAHFGLAYLAGLAKDTAGAEAQYQRAEAAFQRAIQLNPNNPVYRDNHVLSLDALGRTDEAKAERKMANQLRRKNRS